MCGAGDTIQKVKVVGHYTRSKQRFTQRAQHASIIIDAA